VFIPGIKKAMGEKTEHIRAYVIGGTTAEITLSLGELTDTERQILIDGCLINYYAQGPGKN
jgi:aconitate hydratase